MNAFQILDKKGNALYLNDLDREVCEITGNEYNPKHYCRLTNRKNYESELRFVMDTSNWYDTIGWLIAEGNTFQGIIDYYVDGMKEFLGQIDDDSEVITIEKIYPYHIALLRSWIEKGYQPKQVKQ